MAGNRGDYDTWPGSFGQTDETPGQYYRAEATGPTARGGGSAQGAQGAQGARGSPWRGRILWAVIGALLGCILTIVLLVFAGPRPAAAPTQTTQGHLTVSVDDAYLTAAVRQAAANVPAASNVSSLTAHVQSGDHIVVSGDASVFSVPVPLSMTLQPVVNQGALTVQVVDAYVGGFPMPGLLDTQLEGAINAQLGPLGQSTLAGGPHYVVTSVATAPGLLTLTLKQAP
jgi:hypothetical protein